MKQTRNVTFAVQTHIDDAYRAATPKQERSYRLNCILARELQLPTPDRVQRGPAKGSKQATAGKE